MAFEAETQTSKVQVHADLNHVRLLWLQYPPGLDKLLERSSACRGRGSNGDRSKVEERLEVNSCSPVSLQCKALPVTKMHRSSPSDCQECQRRLISGRALKARKLCQAPVLWYLHTVLFRFNTLKTRLEARARHGAAARPLHQGPQKQRGLRGLRGFGKLEDAELPSMPALICWMHTSPQCPDSRHPRHRCTHACTESYHRLEEEVAAGPIQC